MTPLSRDQLAQVVAADIPANSYVNLGVGMPTGVAKHLKPDQGVMLHSENGILGMQALPDGHSPDPDLVNASREWVTLTPGASICDHVVSFSMMRGGHIDVTILGGFQVSVHGDLANWDTGVPGAIPAVGGAMDLVAGAKQVFVMMQHTDRNGHPKLVKACTYPLTGQRVVSRVYTDLGTFDVAQDRFIVRAILAGMTFDQLQAATDAPLELAHDCRMLSV